MVSICFDESRNLIGCSRGRIFPVLPTGNTQFLLPYEAAMRAKNVSDDQKMSKRCLKSSKRRKNPQNTEKG